MRRSSLFPNMPRASLRRARPVVRAYCVEQRIPYCETSLIGSYAAAGIRHILTIRGDMPGGPRVPWVRHPEGLQNATELVAMVREARRAGAHLYMRTSS